MSDNRLYEIERLELVPRASMLSRGAADRHHL